MTPTAAELHRRAVDESIRGRYAAAERTLRRAAAAEAGDVDLRARIMGTQAIVLRHTGRAEQAERLCDEALMLPGLHDGTRAVLLGQLGFLANLGGRLHDAERLLTEAVDALGADPVAQARVHVNRGHTRLQLRNLDGAADDFERAAAAFDAAGLTVDGGQAAHNRAYVALLQGDLVTALEGMQNARPYAAASPVAAGICDADRAEVLRDAGLARDAERLLESVALVFGTHRMPQLRAEAEYQLASSQLLHDPARARRTAAAAARRFQSTGNATWQARADAVRMRAALALGRGIPSVDEVAALAARLRRVGFPADAAALRLSLELWRAGHGQSPGAVRVPPGAPVQVHLLAHEVRAVRAAARGQDAAARRHAASGLDQLAEWRESFGSLDLQSSVAMHGNGLARVGLRSALRSQRPDVVFEWSERTRHLTQQVVPLRPPPDPELAADLAELRMLRADDPAWATTPRGVALRERARARQWAGTGAGGVYRRITLDELCTALDARTALISYVFSGDRLAALVVTDDTRRVVALPDVAAIRELMDGLRADLDMSASVRTGPMAAIVQRSLNGRLQKLAGVLLDEPLRAVGDRRLVITAPGLLSGIPWGMLPGMAARPFTLAPSASQWVRARGGSTGGAGPGARGDARVGGGAVTGRSPGAADAGVPVDGAAVAGAPVGGAGPDARGDVRVVFAAGPGVARGDEEVRTAAAAWAGSRVVTGEAATVDAVTALAADADVLHIAAHGQHAVDNPLFSGFELADGTLFGYDIDRIAHVPDTVILSACESGRSSVRWGEEAIGMARIWLAAGARCVVATPVVVDDATACELLKAMHTELAAGVDAAEALAVASARTGLVTPFQVHGAGF